ncbi:alpha/beta hydrolase [Flavobacterium sp. KB82]|uniref:Alpha/beta hydrolase n=2 Tax=Flavobacterium hungaricum TaxID=2082725 RepID=A0ABR9TLY9_9FLAO|nr:alpha/beta hydrolase [Flavobacterium hungaricum]
MEEINVESNDAKYFSNEHETIERNTEAKSLNAKQDPGGKIRLFYGTNRKPADKIESKQNYGSLDGELQYGICEVNIPQGHKQGEIETPLNLWIFKFLENPQMHVVVEKIQALDYSSFINHFSETLKITQKKNALLFVHGYNNSFDDAAKRTAQLAWDLQFDGFTGFFSWPSAAEIKDYFTDEAAARTSVPSFVQFLEILISETELEQLHIIAHISNCFN